PTAAGPDRSATGRVLPVGKLAHMSVETAPARVEVPSSVVNSVKGFVAAHGGSATAVLQPIGRVGVRVTLVGADGVLGDRVVADLPTAHKLVEIVDGLTASEEWERELT